MKEGEYLVWQVRCFDDTDLVLERCESIPDFRPGGASGVDLKARDAHQLLRGVRLAADQCAQEYCHPRYESRRGWDHDGPRFMQFHWSSLSGFTQSVSLRPNARAQQRIVMCQSTHRYPKTLAVYTLSQVYTPERPVRTNIVIDDTLMKNALKATGLKTKREAVELGLQTLVQLKQQADIRKLRGKLKWEGNLRESRSMER